MSTDYRVEYGLDLLAPKWYVDGELVTNSPWSRLSATPVADADGRLMYVSMDFGGEMLRAGDTLTEHVTFTVS